MKSHDGDVSILVSFDSARVARARASEEGANRFDKTRRDRADSLKQSGCSWIVLDCKRETRATRPTAANRVYFLYLV